VRHHQLLALVVCLGLLPVNAAADRVDRLLQILRGDSSYKVRLRVVITLSEVRDSRVPPALTAALSDENHLVRGLSAQALAQLGVAAALPRLEHMARRERNAYARRMAAKAVRRLAGMTLKGGQRLFVGVGKLHNRSKNGGALASQLFHDALEREFGQVAGVATRWEGGPPSAEQLRRRQMKGFMLGGTIQSLGQHRSGSSLAVHCAVRVELSTFPENSIKAFYSGETSVEVTARGAELESLYRDVFAAAAQEARTQIVRSYLGRQMQSRTVK